MGRATAIIGTMLMIAGCAAQEAPPRVDERLLAALGLAQSYQHQADSLVDLGQREDAINVVRQVLEIPFPEGAPEGEDVQLDAYGRLAELHLETGNEEAAEASLEQGLSRATRRSYFKARLFAVRGRVFRARADRLRGEGQVDASREASREAIRAFEQSIEMNRSILGMDSDVGVDQRERTSDAAN